jgi:hypothetical protein
MTKEMPAEPKKPILEPEHAEWLVKNRGDNQVISAKLYRLLKSYPDQLNEFADEVQMLVSVAFSLWRSAFLSDKTGLRVDTTKNAVIFLAEMIQNNAIAYGSERTAKDWTFNYYAANARYRLDALKEKWSDFDMPRLLPPKGQQNPKNRWEYLQEAFCQSVNHFEDVLIAAKKRDKKKK